MRRSFCLLPLLLVLISLPFKSQSQTPAFSYQGYTWNQNRQRIALSPEDEKAPAILLKLLLAHEYALEPNGRNLVIYTTEHKITRVNSDDAIEQHNKIFIPMAGVQELVELKARSITPRGQVVELDQRNIKEVKDSDGDRGFRIFAVEGVEKGESAIRWRFWFQV